MKAQIVSFHCVLRDKMGTVLSSTFNQDVINQTQGPNELLKGLINGLQNLHKGEKRQIRLSAEEAYGFYNPDLVIEMSVKRNFQGQHLTPGAQVVDEMEDGKTKVFRVVGILGDQITLDGNHPLAGQDLVFDIETTEARDATVDELTDTNLKKRNQYLH